MKKLKTGFISSITVIAVAAGGFGMAWATQAVESGGLFSAFFQSSQSPSPPAGVQHNPSDFSSYHNVCQTFSCGPLEIGSPFDVKPRDAKKLLTKCDQQINAQYQAWLAATPCGCCTDLSYRSGDPALDPRMQDDQFDLTPVDTSGPSEQPEEFSLSTTGSSDFGCDLATVAAGLEIEKQIKNMVKRCTDAGRSYTLNIDDYQIGEPVRSPGSGTCRVTISGSGRLTCSGNKDNKKWNVRRSQTMCITCACSGGMTPQTPVDACPIDEAEF